MRLLGLALLLCGRPLASQSVRTENGNLVFTDKSVRTTKLTSQGLDYGASLSFDGVRVVFVRRSRGEKQSDELGEFNGHEIWVVPVNAPNQERPVLAGNPKGHQWNGLVDPQFSMDGRYVFFRNWFGNGTALQRLDLTTGNIKRLGRGTCMEFEVIRQGEYKGRLIVHEDRLKLGTGHIDLYWICDDDGNYLDIIGDRAGDLALFKEMYVGR